VRFATDYRIDCEDGALFTRWGSLLHRWHDLRMDGGDPNFKNAGKEHAAEWPFVVHELYQTDEIDGDAYVNRSRFMFVIVGAALALLLAWWTWKLAGPIAAIAATALFCLDPNFLAHSALVKNDVPLALLMLWLMAAVWML